MKSTNIMTKKDIDTKKVSKKSIVSIKLKKPAPSELPANPHDISSIAKQFKDRLSKATESLIPSTTPTTTTTTTLTDLSDSDWSNKKPTLHNLQLLKKYLTFVSQETTSISFKQDQIQLDLNPNDANTHSSFKSARLGATLIESLVHDSTAIMEKKFKQNNVAKQPISASRSIENQRRRPGRPPKSSASDEDRSEHQRMRQKRKSIIQRQPLRKKRESIRCICDTPNEEFGSMVQCDDCSHWLHLECLELNNNALEETFRCPACFLSLGTSNDKNAKLLSSITWRYAAQWKSQRLAAIQTEDDDDIDTDDMDTSMSYPPSPIASPTITKSAPPPLDLNHQDMYSTGLPSPETPTDWPDVSSESRFSSSQESASEANTPNASCSSDPFELKEDDMMLDSQSLEILSRLAYLQSLDSVKKELFASNATDVFLCENATDSSATSVSSTQNPSPHCDIPPSAICSQDLSQFSFESGPFWEPLL